METKITSLEPDGLNRFLSDFCDFNRDDAYILIAMARPKENEQINHGHMPNFREIITSKDKIEEKLRKLLTLGRNYEPKEGGDLTFRMYITANSRDCIKSYHMYQKELIDMNRQMFNGHEQTHNHIKRIDKEWISTLQSDTNKRTSRFIIDIDRKSETLLRETATKLEERTDIREIIETPNGYHIITAPFNYTELDTSDDIEIKTDSLMFLTII